MVSPAQRVSRVANQTYRHGSRIVTGSPWWQHLPEDFSEWQDDFELSGMAKLMVAGTKHIDHVLRTGLATMAGVLAIPTTLKPSQVALDREHREFYVDIARNADVEAFYQRPARGVTMRRQKSTCLQYHPSVGHIDLLSFDSAFEPVNPALRESYGRFKRNGVAWAEHWQHGDKPRATIIVIHGFTADPYWINSRFLAMPWFYEQGYDVLLVTLPFHGKRQSRLSPFSGHGYFSHGFCHMNETMAHAIHDIRVFMDHLEDQGVPQMGVTGISLGGYTSALLACVEDRLAFCVPNVPVVSIIDIMLEWFPSGALVRTGLKLAGMSITEARAAVAVQSALSFPVKLPRDRLMLIAGAGDRLAPPKHTHLLWEHWRRCRLHWFPGNHLLHLDQGRYLKAMRNFMHHIGFLPESNTPAK
ncbi:MAG: alpha/beta hydrolase family protein [Paraperlucidibaca sp.]